jgi:cbb3-type cytochrome oxidase maturation protein
VAAGFLLLFLWAVRSGQYDDSETPAIRILFESALENQSKKKAASTEKDAESLS